MVKYTQFNRLFQLIGKRLILMFFVLITSEIFAQDVNNSIPQPLAPEHLSTPRVTPTISPYYDLGPAEGRKVLAIVDSRWLFEDQIDRKINGQIPSQIR